MTLTPTCAMLPTRSLPTPAPTTAQEEKAEAVRILIDKFEKGHEPIATKAMICRTLGQLRDPRA